MSIQQQIVTACQAKTQRHRHVQKTKWEALTSWKLLMNSVQAWIKFHKLCAMKHGKSNYTFQPSYYMFHATGHWFDTIFRHLWPSKWSKLYIVFCIFKMCILQRDTLTCKTPILVWYACRLIIQRSRITTWNAKSTIFNVICFWLLYDKTSLTLQQGMFLWEE